MKFIVDAHIPQAICYLLKNNGYDAIHTIELPQKNDTDDIEINKISVSKKRIVITKALLKNKLAFFTLIFRLYLFD